MRGFDGLSNAVIETKNGRVLSGMIVGQDRNSVVLRMPGSESDQQVHDSVKGCVTQLHHAHGSFG